MGSTCRGSLSRASENQVQPLSSDLESGVEKHIFSPSYAPEGSVRFSRLFCSKCYENRGDLDKQQPSVGLCLNHCLLAFQHV